MVAASLPQRMRGVAGAEHAHAEGAPRPRPRGDARAAAGRRPGVVAASEPPPNGGDITLRPLQGLGGGVAERKQRAAEAGALGGVCAARGGEVAAASWSCYFELICGGSALGLCRSQ